MAAQSGIKVSGAKEFRAAMKRMEADLKDYTAVNKRAAQMVADTARERAPVLTGALQGSIRPGATRTRGYVKAGGRGIPYAGPIHFGWPRRNIRPQPFIFDALDERKDAVVEQYERHIEALVEKVGRETPP